MASEAKTENGTDGSGKDDQDADKGKDKADQGANKGKDDEQEDDKGKDKADQGTNKGKDDEQEDDKGKDEDTSQGDKDSTESTAQPPAETDVDGSGKKSPENTRSRAPSPPTVSNSRPASSVGKTPNPAEEANKQPGTNPSDPPPRGGTPGGRKTAEGEKPSTPAPPDTPRDEKNSELMSPELVTPRSIVSPPLTAMTMDVSMGVPCDICPQMGESQSTKAEFVCHGCVQRFCVRCAKRHIDTAVFANHEVDPMVSDDKVKALQELSCRFHPQRRLEFFCQGCQEAACGMCISFNHGGQQHQIGRVENLSSNRHVLLSRHEQLVRGELSPSKTAATPDRSRPVPFLLWKRESVLRDGTQEDGAAHLCGPSDITFLPGGQLIVADRWNQSIKYFDENGENAMVVLEKLAPLRVCCTASGRIAVVDDFAQGQIKLIRSEPFIKKTQEPHNKADSNNDMDTVDSKNADKVPSADNARNVEAVQEKNSEQNKDVLESDKENKDIAKARNTSSQSDRASLASKQSTRSQGGRSADQDNFRDLSTIINSMDVQDTWKPKDMKRPWAVAVNKYDQWLVSEYEQYVHSSVTIYNSDGSRDRSFGSYGDRDDQFEWPAYLTSDSRRRIIVSDYYNHTVKVFDQRGNFITKLGKGWGKKDGHLTFPKGVSVDSDDHILVVDSGNNRVCEFAPDGAFVRNLLTNADGLVEPEGISFVELAEGNQEEEEQGKDSGLTAQGTSNSQKLEGAQSDAEQGANSQTEGSRGGPQRRLAVTLCKGHEYSALLVYGFEQAES